MTPDGAVAWMLKDGDGRVLTISREKPHKYPLSGETIVPLFARDSVLAEAVKVADAYADESNAEVRKWAFERGGCEAASQFSRAMALAARQISASIKALIGSAS